jgi:hypothetical protein
MHRTRERSGLWTASAIGVLASVVAAVIHEAGGHGGACLAVGGRPTLLSSLFLDCTVQRPAIALGGPLANLLLGLLAAAFAYRFRHARGRRHLQLFCWLLAAYDLFLATGYLLFSGATGRGDWAFLFGVGLPSPAERSLLVVVGVVGLVASLRLLVASRSLGEPQDAAGAGGGGRLLAIYLGASLVSLLAAAFDPAGLQAVIRLPPAAPLTGLALLWTGRVLRRRFDGEGLRLFEVPPHRGWLIAGVVATALFIGVLGPGIRF